MSEERRRGRRSGEGKRKKRRCGDGGEREIEMQAKKTKDVESRQL